MPSNSIPDPTHRDAAAAGDDVDTFPLDASVRRVRLRRGGPRTPMPLLPLIAIAAGIGIAYVSETAHVTRATYEATNLGNAQQQLRSENTQLGEELARLQSSERVVAAAQQLGMRPADKWGYAASRPVPLVPSSAAPQLSTASRDSALLQFLAALRGAFGAGDRSP